MYAECNGVVFQVLDIRDAVHLDYIFLTFPSPRKTTGTPSARSHPGLLQWMRMWKDAPCNTCFVLLATDMAVEPKTLKKFHIRGFTMFYIESLFRLEIHYINSIQKGVGRLMVNFLQDHFPKHDIIAKNVVDEDEVLSFYKKMNFVTDMRLSRVCPPSNDSPTSAMKIGSKKTTSLANIPPEYFNSSQNEVYVSTQPETSNRPIATTHSVNQSILIEEID
jgi:hypothetical protein